ncbi:uncharacterized protein LOC143042772 [Mytilus galloprovincialis]|uniref:uncharacterized protein LOC143042772 n=1 Tax=Mytilus galloprovincialis TaxID=29158 RepID=UPI003F7C83C6
MGNKLMAMKAAQQQLDGRETDDIGNQDATSKHDENQNVPVQNTSDTKRETQTVQIGNRSASLFLSSASINLSKAKPKDTNNAKPSPSTTPAPISRQTTKTKREKSRLIPDEMLQIRPKREFTFTGYDIMADVASPECSDDDEDDDDDTRQIKSTYRNTCKMLGVTPASSFKNQVATPAITMRSHPTGPAGVRAMAIALVDNQVVTSLDLEDNGLFTDGAKYIAEMLHKNRTIIDLNIAENLIGTEGVRAIADVLHVNHKITSLDISGSGLVDTDALVLADILQNAPCLRELILSHNKFCGEGGMILGSAIAMNDTLRILDLSWNHLRGKGAMAIVAALQKNIGLRKLDISWNGYGKDECFILSHALQENTTLKELDISNNRLNKEAIKHLLDGIQNGDGLETLRIRGNPVSPELALAIIKVIQESENCRIQQLDMGDIDVNEDFVSVVDDITMYRPFEVLYSNVLKHGGLQKREVEGIDYNVNMVDELFKYMHENNYRVIDLMKWLDKDGSMSVSRDEFKQGMKTAQFPLTEFQLDKMVDELDMDGDGEVDFSELLAGERIFRRRMRRRLEREKANAKRRAEFKRTKVLLTIGEHS